MRWGECGKRAPVNALRLSSTNPTGSGAARHGSSKADTLPVSPVYFVTGAGNTATLALSVPNNPNLMGLTFYQQGWSFNPAANPTGMTTSNSARLTIGRL